MPSWLVWPVVLVALLLPHPGFTACMLQLPYCQKLPDRANKTSAIFLGIVKSATPPGQEAPIARFEVMENFVGAESAGFEVHVTSDLFVGSIPQQTPPFREGEAWLIEAYYDNHRQQWKTSTCQRTKLAADAVEDLQVLRTWAAGQRLPTRITGQVVNPGERKNVAGAHVYLRSAKGTILATTDGVGKFSFDNVEPAVYEAATDGARTMRIDLTRAWCFTAVLLVQ